MGKKGDAAKAEGKEKKAKVRPEGTTKRGREKPWHEDTTGLTEEEMKEASRKYRYARFTSEGVRLTDTPASKRTYATRTAPEEPISVAGEDHVIKSLKINRQGGGPGCSTVSFTMYNTSAPLANMLRRLLISEVPTMAFDRVLILENDGVVVDDLLAQRLAMTPIIAPPAKFEYQEGNNKREIKNIPSMLANYTPGVDFDNLNPARHLLFEIDVKAPSNAPVTCVYSKELKWIPLPGQEELVKTKAVRLVHDNILLAKLGRNQKLKVKVVAVKGLGWCHSKWSPVSACYYKMKNVIDFDVPCKDDDAWLLKKKCPMKVFDIEEGDVAFVARAKACTMCRECLSIMQPPTKEQLAEFEIRKEKQRKRREKRRREKEKQDEEDIAAGRKPGPDLVDSEDEELPPRPPYVNLKKNQNIVHFEFETVGQYPLAEDILRVALNTFAERCRYLKKLVRATPPIEKWRNYSPDMLSKRQKRILAKEKAKAEAKRKREEAKKKRKARKKALALRKKRKEKKAAKKKTDKENDVPRKPRHKKSGVTPTPKPKTAAKAPTAKPAGKTPSAKPGPKTSKTK